MTNDQIIEQVWETNPQLQQLVSEMGMTGFQIALRKMYDGKHMYYLQSLSSNVVSMTVNDWGTLRQLVNDRSDPVDRMQIIKDVQAAIAAKDAAALAKVLVVLIQSECTLNAMPLIPAYQP